jgi:hypothetical protein
MLKIIENEIESIRHNFKYKLYFGLLALIIYEVVVCVFLKSYMYIYTNWLSSIFAVKYTGEVFAFIFGYSFGKILSDQIGAGRIIDLFYRKIFFDFIKRIAFMLALVALVLAIDPLALMIASLWFVQASSWCVFSILLIGLIFNLIVFLDKFPHQITKWVLFACVVGLFLMNGLFLFSFFPSSPKYLIGNFISLPPLRNEKLEKRRIEHGKEMECQKKSTLANDEYIKLNGIKKEDGTIFASEDVRNRAAKAGGDVWKNCTSALGASYKGF